MRLSIKQMFTATVISMLAISHSYSFDSLPTVKDTYQDIKSKPAMITETIYTLIDENGKLVELPTQRKTVKFYDWQNNKFVMVQYNDEGNPYLYEKVTFNNEGLMISSVLKTQKVSLDKTYEYNSDFSGYDIYTVTDGEKLKTNSFELVKED